MDYLNAYLTPIFFPVLKPFFAAIDSVFNHIYMPWARICAIGLFLLTMIWVFTLNEKYVNLDSPKKDVWHDLRFWTIVSMLPHVVVYMFF